jgi:hypothetical protein
VMRLGGGQGGGEEGLRGREGGRGEPLVLNCRICGKGASQRGHRFLGRHRCVLEVNLVRVGGGRGGQGVSNNERREGGRTYGRTMASTGLGVLRTIPTRSTFTNPTREDML